KQILWGVANEILLKVKHIKAPRSTHGWIIQESCQLNIWHIQCGILDIPLPCAACLNPAHGDGVIRCVRECHSDWRNRAEKSAQAAMSSVFRACVKLVLEGLRR